MSGICGLLNLDGKPVSQRDIGLMTAALEQRGPEGTSVWFAECLAIGHTLLATTPELQFEKQPFVHAASGCAITADVRLDNREDLARALLDGRALQAVGDAELILLAYLNWGKDCLDRLLGDFAFAIWDPRSRSLLLGRDHFGMRPLYYYHRPGDLFAFASDARAIVALEAVPRGLSEGRIADFLVPALEWYDYESSFFEDVFRLPQGHRAEVRDEGMFVTEYWHPQPGPDLGTMSDEDYRQGFVEVFTRSVEARLRAPPGKVGSTMSGGMDSGSTVVVAKKLLDQHGDGPLRTYSGVRTVDPAEAERLDCLETTAVLATAEQSLIRPTLAHPGALQDIVGSLSDGLEEPFDGTMTVLKTLYLRAHADGIKVMLDGGGGDVVLSEGTYIARLMRQGNWRLAFAEIEGLNRYWGAGLTPSSVLHYARSAFAPEFIKRLVRWPRQRRQIRSYRRDSLIARPFADRVDIEDRYRKMLSLFDPGPKPDYETEYCRAIWPNMMAGRQRYARVAAATGMEARDPFMDKRVVEYCARLPGHIKFRDGWPKMILRDIMRDELPEEVRWSRRNPHVGWLFTEAVTRHYVETGKLRFDHVQESIARYVDPEALHGAWRDFRRGDDSGLISYASFLSKWLGAVARSPVVPDQ